MSTSHTTHGHAPSSRSHSAGAKKSSKRLIQVAVIVVCLGGGALAYYLMTREPAPTPQETQAEQHANDVQKAMQKATPAAEQTPPPEPERTAPRAAIPAPSPK